MFLFCTQEIHRDKFVLKSQHRLCAREDWFSPAAEEPTKPKKANGLCCMQWGHITQSFNNQHDKIELQDK